MSNQPRMTVVNDTEWHLDKRVPVTLILAIVIQTFSFGWLAKGIDSRVDVNSHDISAIIRELEIRRPQVEDHTIAIAVLRQQLIDIKEGQDRMLVILQRLDEEK